MIVYTDLLVAGFIVVLLLGSSLVLTDSSKNYEANVTKQQDVAQTLYQAFVSCGQETCVTNLEAAFSQLGLNLTLSESQMVVAVGT